MSPGAKGALLAAVSLLAVLFCVPTIGVLLSSFKGTAEIAAGRLWFGTSGFTLDNYAEILGKRSVYQYLLNTVLVTVPASVVSISLPPSSL